MDFNVTSSRKTASAGLASPLGNGGQAIPASRLSMYQAAPQGEVSLEEFEQFALDRLQGSGQPSWHRKRVVEALSLKHLGSNFSLADAGRGDVALAELDAVALESFPLCMRHLYFK
eukprot:SM005127S17657  [mRNA]  locus=s5127:94:900:- [translate_table: standard]